MPKFRDDAMKAEQEVKQMPWCEIIANAGQGVHSKEKGLMIIRDASLGGAKAIIFPQQENNALSDDWLIEFLGLTRHEKIDFVGEPHNQDEIAQFERIGVDRYKIAYSDIVDIGLLDSIRITGKPVLLSVGVAAYPEIEKALRTLRPIDDCGTVTLLHKVFEVEQANLRAILDLKEEIGFKFNCQVGLESGLAEECDLVALAYGVSCIERDIASLATGDFATCVRRAERALDYRKFFTDREIGLRRDRDE